MNVGRGTTSDIERMRRYFEEIVVSGDSGAIDAAARAAADVLAGGASEEEARAVGKSEIRRRNATGAGSRSTRQDSTRREARGGSRKRASGLRDPAPPFADGGDNWPTLLAPRLLAEPPRWGWQPAEVAVAQEPEAPRLMDIGPKPVWKETPHPDDSALFAARAAAMRKLGFRVVGIVVAAMAFVVYRSVIAAKVGGLGPEAIRVYGYTIIAAAILAAILVLESLSAVNRAAANIRRFRQPYLAMRNDERQRHQQALREWEEARRRFDAEQLAAKATAASRRTGPQWFPVHPVSEPVRVDVIGGDPLRHGWAGLLALLGTSLLLRNHRLTVLDFTGQDVGGGLARLAATGGRQVRTENVGQDTDLDVFEGMTASEIAESLAYALAAPGGSGDKGETRQERALAQDVLGRVIACLDGPVTCGRLAAGLRVMQRGADTTGLSPAEAGRLVAGIGDIGQDEWTSRRLRFWAGQLETLAQLGPRTPRPHRLWSGAELTVIATPGGRGDRKELTDRLILQLAQHAMRTQGRLGAVLVVAGADHLGAEALTRIADHARSTGLRLALFVDQPQGDIEQTVGTGGVVCVMKMYNHRDAAIAAEFIGKGYKFVVSQFTRTVGKSFTDGGNDGFSAATNDGSSTSTQNSKTQQGTTESRGHTWSGGRNWSVGDNISTSDSASRVYEFLVDPQSILGMPETAFILVDNSGAGRRVVMADSYPGIVLLPRVSAIPRPQ